MDEVSAGSVEGGTAPRSIPRDNGFGVWGNGIGAAAVGAGEMGVGVSGSGSFRGESPLGAIGGQRGKRG